MDLLAVLIFGVFCGFGFMCVFDHMHMQKPAFFSLMVAVIFAIAALATLR